MKHIPVLLSQVLEHALLPPVHAEQDRLVRIWDGTFGRGGHTEALLNKFSGARVLATDRDQAAIDYGFENFKSHISEGRLHLKHFNFHHFKNLDSFVCNEAFDSVLIDLGVSSPQLDEPDRGFSFYNEGPLDMRMDQSQEFTARDIVNFWSEQDLIRLFQEVGEISRPHRVVKEILNRRKNQPFATTKELSLLIERTFGWRKKGKHPATNFFLALRMEVNQELVELESSLSNIMKSALKPKGRLLVITFHSSEDRIVKRLFKSSGHIGENLTKKVIAPERSEILLNPRSRSAKLRVFQRGDLHNE